MILPYSFCQVFERVVYKMCVPLFVSALQPLVVKIRPILWYHYLKTIENLSLFKDQEIHCRLTSRGSCANKCWGRRISEFRLQKFTTPLGISRRISDPLNDFRTFFFFYYFAVLTFSVMFGAFGYFVEYFGCLMVILTSLVAI